MISLIVVSARVLLSTLASKDIRIFSNVCHQTLKGGYEKQMIAFTSLQMSVRSSEIRNKVGLLNVANSL